VESRHGAPAQGAEIQSRIAWTTRELKSGRSLENIAKRSTGDRADQEAVGQPVTVAVTVAFAGTVTIAVAVGNAVTLT
jgi:hypothetical protein